MPQSIHSEPEIRPESLLGRRVSPPRNGGPVGHDGIDLTFIHLLIKAEASTELLSQ